MKRSTIILGILIFLCLLGFALNPDPAVVHARNQRDADAVHRYLSGEPVHRSKAFWVTDRTATQIRLEELTSAEMITSQECEEMLRKRFDYYITRVNEVPMNK